MIRQYLRDMTNNHKTQNEWKIQLFIHLWHYKLHKTSFNRGGSYKDSPELLKNKKEIINPKNNGDNYFQYAITVALNHQNINNHPERVTNIKPFINK